MKTVFSGLGHLFVDNRCSGGTVEEDDLLGCKHCPKFMKRSAWSQDGAFCHCCDGPLCSTCAAIPGCVPEMKRLEDAVNDHYRREQNAKIIGV